MGLRSATRALRACGAVSALGVAALGARAERAGAAPVEAQTPAPAAATADGARAPSPSDFFAADLAREVARLRAQRRRPEAISPL